MWFFSLEYNNIGDFNSIVAARLIYFNITLFVGKDSVGRSSLHVFLICFFPLNFFIRIVVTKFFFSLRSFHGIRLEILWFCVYFPQFQVGQFQVRMPLRHVCIGLLCYLYMNFCVVSLSCLLLGSVMSPYFCS